MNYSVFGHLKGAELSGVAFKEHLHRKKIIAQLSMHRESTIPELADFLNISVPKANELTMGLDEEGLVREAGHKSEGVGRKASIYTLNQSSCYFLGVEIKKYNINIALMGFDKSIAESQLDIPFPFLNPHESLDAIVKTINEFLEHSVIPKEKIVGMGLSVA